MADNAAPQVADSEVSLPPPFPSMHTTGVEGDVFGPRVSAFSNITGSLGLSSLSLWMPMNLAFV
jgi:hypothetical protein